MLHQKIVPVDLFWQEVDPRFIQEKMPPSHTLQKMVPCAGKRNCHWCCWYVLALVYHKHQSCSVLPPFSQDFEIFNCLLNWNAKIGNLLGETIFDLDLDRHSQSWTLYDLAGQHFSAKTHAGCVIIVKTCMIGQTSFQRRNSVWNVCAWLSAVPSWRWNLRLEIEKTKLWCLVLVEVLWIPQK